MLGTFIFRLASAHNTSLWQSRNLSGRGCACKPRGHCVVKGLHAYPCSFQRIRDSLRQGRIHTPELGIDSKISLSVQGGLAFRTSFSPVLGRPSGGMKERRSGALHFGDSGASLTHCMEQSCFPGSRVLAVLATAYPTHSNSLPDPSPNCSVPGLSFF